MPRRTSTPTWPKTFKNLTTYPPVVLSAHFTADTVLSPQAQRDTDTLDLGYHYVPLDYCWSGLNLTLYNNLFSKGTCTFTTTYQNPSCTVKDSLFNSDTLTKSGPASFTADYNGYRTGLSSLGGANNKTGLTMDFQSGPATNWFGVLGSCYYPATGGSLTQLIDTGSRSPANATLFHDTVKTATGTKEGTDAVQTVDIGFHFIGVDANGQPNDYDGDGLPDYTRDRTRTAYLLAGFHALPRGLAWSSASCVPPQPVGSPALSCSLKATASTNGGAALESALTTRIPGFRALNRNLLVPIPPGWHKKCG
jgi:hypothetical protein